MFGRARATITLGIGPHSSFFKFSPTKDLAPFSIHTPQKNPLLNLSTINLLSLVYAKYNWSAIIWFNWFVLILWTTMWRHLLNQCSYGRKIAKFNAWFPSVRTENSELLWPPYVIGADIICLPCNFYLLSSLWPPYEIRHAIMFLPCGFYLLVSIFFPRLMSAAGDWMYTILPHNVIVWS